MDIKYTKKEKNEIEFKVKDEDIGIYNLIIDIASSKREVDFVSKKEGDQKDKEFTIYFRTNTKNAKKVLFECIDEAKEELDNALKHLETQAKKIDE